MLCVRDGTNADRCQWPTGCGEQVDGCANNATAAAMVRRPKLSDRLQFSPLNTVPDLHFGLRAYMQVMNITYPKLGRYLGAAAKKLGKPSRPRHCKPPPTPQMLLGDVSLKIEWGTR